MQTGYFWPIYVQLDEVCFPFHASRSADFVCHALGLKPVPNAVLLTTAMPLMNTTPRRRASTMLAAGLTGAEGSSMR